jgi:ABC-type transporter Mla subunit MlaD
MRRIALILTLIAAAAGSWIVASASAGDAKTYKVELDNGFGLVQGSDVKVAGVITGSIKGLDVNEAKRAVVTIEVTGPFTDFREDATCSSEPQSLIAENFLDCQPGNSPTKSNGFIPVANTTTTVGPDVVNNTLRQPFKQRFQLLINEFGTALAGNPKNLNEAIRRGAPALRSLREALQILGKQNKIIANLNVDSDEIIGKLAENRANVVRFIHNAKATAETSASVRTDVGRNFHLLPDFLAELQPTLVELGKVADEQTPLLTDLRISAPELNRLVRLLPPFNNATRPSLLTLGDAAAVGNRALTEGQDEIAQLAAAAKAAPPATKDVAALLKSLDDPRRAVEEDARANTDNCNPTPQAQLPAAITDPNNPNGTITPPTVSPQCPAFPSPASLPDKPGGYTGLEGLFNYGYWQTAAINQFDQVGHMLHFILYEVGSSPCAEYNPGHKSGPGVPVGTDTPPVGELNPDLSDLNRCVSWLGKSQPDICRKADAQGNCTAANAVTPYGRGSNVGTPGNALIGPYPEEVCNGQQATGFPAPPASTNTVLCPAGGGQGNDPLPLNRRASTPAGLPQAGGPGGPNGLLPGLPNLPNLGKGIGGLLGLQDNALKDLSGSNNRNQGSPGLGVRGSGSGSPSTANDLLNFLFGS